MDKRIEIINWLINEASEQQLDGLYDIIINQDYVYGTEQLINNKEDYKNYIKNIIEDNE